MARLAGSAALYEVADTFRQRCLLEGRSLLWPQHQAWTSANLSRLKDRFADAQETKGFLGKWREQLADEPPDIHRIAADLLAFYWLCPTTAGSDTKLEQVKELVSWKLAADSPDYSLLEGAFKAGFANPGQQYTVARNVQISFFIAFAQGVLAGRADPRDPESSKRLADSVMQEVKNTKPARHVLLHLFFPDRFERIVSHRDKEKISRVFADLADGAQDLDDAIFNIRKNLTQRYGREIDFYSDREIRDQWKPKDEDDREKVGPRFWIEKTLVEGRPDRQSGEYSLGRVLWSPQTGKDGAEIYRFMREVRPGDIVLHLTDNEAFSGISLAADTAVEFSGVAGTEWGERPSYRISLRSFTKLDPPLMRDVVFGSPYRDQLLRLLKSGTKNLFYDERRGELALHQGAYLTPAPIELVAILEDAYRASSGRSLSDLVPEIKSIMGTTKPLQRSVWIFQANPRYYDIRESLQSLREQQWLVAEFRSEIRPGHKVYLWESGHEGGVVAVAEVLDNPSTRPMPEEEKAFVRESGRFEKEEPRVTLRISRIVDPPVGRDRILRHPALASLSILKRPQGTNYPVTDSEDRVLETLLPPSATNPEYSLAQCAEETGFDQATLERWVRAVERKGHAVIYGPPGTGKTFLAERLARHLVGGTDGLIAVVQFHPAYTYEDFVQGIRPSARAGGGLDYPVVPGRFSDFCERAKARSGRCVLIIDEINRANLARAFGELMYLLEYRDREVPLATGGTFRIPANVRVIGTMNTADRSIALVDHALRRRFAFLALEPRYEVLERYHTKTGFPVDGLIAVLKSVNTEIGDPNYAVGISFFLRPDIAAQIGDIWQMEIEPYLEEFFFDQRDKVNRFRWAQVKDRILR